MILLDTNLVSEPFRPAPDDRVISWMDTQPIETLYLCTITVAELRVGVAVLPAGKRRAALHEQIEKRLLPRFVGRVLSFDLACAQAYAELMAKAQSTGLAIAAADGYIAAVAAANGFAMATRDVGPLKAAGLRVINPWD